MKQVTKLLPSGHCHYEGPNVIHNQIIGHKACHFSHRKAIAKFLI
jgi:hypothetical protein